MHTILQNTQSLINEGFLLLFVFLVFAAAASVVLNPRVNKYLIIVSSIIAWFFSTLHMRFDFKSELLEFFEFFIFAIWVLICFKDKTTKKIIFASLALFTWFVADLITYTVFSLGLGIKDYFCRIDVCALYLFLVLVLISAFTIIWLKLESKIINRKSFINVLSFMTVLYAQIIIVAVDIIILFERGNNMNLISKYSITGATVLGFAFLDLMSFVFIRNNRKMEKMKSENDVLFTENRIQGKYYANVQKSVDETVKLRHDINNLVSVVEVLVAEADESSVKKAKELTKQVKEATEKTSIPAVCENKLVNLILYDKLSSVSEKNISVKYNIILKDNCGIDDIDLCRIFVNLIDNSISALTDYNGDNKCLVISCRESDGIIYIKTVNKTSPVKNKTTQKGRGYGLKILNEICEKYNGEVVTSLNGEDFSVIVSLNTRL